MVGSIKGKKRLIGSIKVKKKLIGSIKVKKRLIGSIKVNFLCHFRSCYLHISFGCILSCKSDPIFLYIFFSGEIFSECNFDREDDEFYQVPVAVTDNAGRMGFSLIEVNVRDLNDNPPRFLMNDYKFVVSPSAPVNSSFAKVSK